MTRAWRGQVLDADGVLRIVDRKKVSRGEIKRQTTQSPYSPYCASGLLQLIWDVIELQRGRARVWRCEIKGNLRTVCTEHAAAWV